MAKKKFTPITGELEKLSPQALQEYVLAVCEFLDVPSELGLIGVRWMDGNDGSGKRNLVVYVEKGATDLIRDKRNIDVDTMEETNGPGYVGWKVRGHNDKGRHEIAVGTVSTEGKKGKQLADAVMVAQTKACRRMTLQFAGGGFLDSSELDSTTTDLMNSAQSLRELSTQPIYEQPTAIPNAAPGVLTQTTGFAVPTPLKAGDTIIFHDGQKGTVLSVSEPASNQPQTAAASTVADKETELTGGTQPAAAVIAASPDKIRKPRTRKKSVSLDSTSVPQPASTALSVSAQVTEKKPVETTAVAAAMSEKPASFSIDPTILKAADELSATMIASTKKAVEEALSKPSDNGTTPDEVQLKEYKRRLSKYINDILPMQGGFTQSEGVTRHDKLSKFFKKMFPKANTKSMSVVQWDEFFAFMDGTLATKGATGLVALIEAQIAVKESAQEENNAEDSD